VAKENYLNNLLILQSTFFDVPNLEYVNCAIEKGASVVHIPVL